MPSGPELHGRFGLHRSPDRIDLPPGGLGGHEVGGRLIGYDRSELVPPGRRTGVLARRALASVGSSPGWSGLGWDNAREALMRPNG